MSDLEREIKELRNLVEEQKIVIIEHQDEKEKLEEKV